MFEQIPCALLCLPSILQWQFNPQYTAVKLGWQWEFWVDLGRRKYSVACFRVSWELWPIYWWSIANTCCSSTETECQGLLNHCWAAPCTTLLNDLCSVEFFSSSKEEIKKEGWHRKIQSFSFSPSSLAQNIRAYFLSSSWGF